jgi:RimJ/RimL family protein N-acetyltransferase
MAMPVMQPNLQPTLKGELLELRPLQRDDFDALYSSAADPLIWEQHPEPDRYKREVFQGFFERALESKGAFAIIERKTGRIIGSSRFYGYDAERREVFVGYTFLERAFWGGHYNRELKQLMLDHAFGFVDHVLFHVGENNLRSQKALQKLGATVLTRTELPDRNGTMQPHLIFVISR